MHIPATISRGLLALVLGLSACRDDAPVVLTVTPFATTIAENPAQDQALGSVSVNTNQRTLAYALSDQEPANALAIDARSGALRVATPSLFDYETHPIITATLLVAGGGVQETVPVTVTLTDQDPELTDYQRQVIAYFKEIALGFEFGNASAITRKWRRPMRVFVGGEANDALRSELDTIVSEINALVSDGFTVAVVSDSSRSNYYVFLGPGEQYARHYPGQADLVDDNWGLFSVFWNGQNEINRGHMYVDTERPALAGQRHLLREEFTQSLGLARDASIYPLSIFLSDWSTTTAYADVDRDLIRLLYHPNLTVGLDESEVGAVLEDILLAE